jgi:hypothetical protein
MSAIEQARAKALEQYQGALGAISGSETSLDKETAAWAAYYQKLAQGARGAAPQSVAPTVSTTTALPPGGPAAGGPAAGGPAAVTPTRAPSITPLPLARYTGAWTYPTVGGMFHGPEPEFVDFVVHEQNGHADGTLYARFKLPPGSAGDPLVRFDFSGDFKNTRNQSFNLMTSDGARGTVDLIPGTAFNLLEVTFQTEPRAGKIRAGDLLLVKK